MLSGGFWGLLSQETGNRSRWLEVNDPKGIGSGKGWHGAEPRILGDVLTFNPLKVKSSS